MLPNIDDILDTAIKHIYALYYPKEGVALLQKISAENIIIKEFFLPDNFNSKALARPVYWHFMENYAEILPTERIGNEELIFVKLRKPLPYLEDFKREILSQEWVKTYLESNVKQLPYL